jgi:predicted GNAT family N-acyltransferase
MNFKWTEDTSSQIYKDALAIRKQVFVEEQNVPAELEVDDLEDKTAHVVGYHENKPCVTARIYEVKPKVYKVQRVAVSKEFRQLGNGYKIMEEIERYVKELKGEKLTLGSQDHAIPFYEKVGYRVHGEGFLDAGIPHHMMIKSI